MELEHPLFPGIPLKPAPPGPYRYVSMFKPPIMYEGYEESEHPMTDKFVSPCPPPTPYQRELLEILIEECSEIQQRATKMLRFGVEEVQPGQDLNNAQRLAREFGDAMEVAAILQSIGLLPSADVLEGRRSKSRQLAKYMQHQETAS